MMAMFASPQHAVGSPSCTLYPVQIQRLCPVLTVSCCLHSAPVRNNRGNHDNLLSCGEAGASASKALAAEVYSHFFNSTPYSSRDVGGWKVVALSSMYGGWMAAQHASMRHGGLEVGYWCRLERIFLDKARL